MRDLKSIADELAEISVALRTTNYPRAERIYMIACELSEPPAQRAEVDAPSIRRWKDTKVTVPADGDDVIGYWTSKGVTGGKDDISVVHYYAGMWHEPSDDEDDYRAPDLWMALPSAPADDRAKE